MVEAAGRSLVDSGLPSSQRRDVVNRIRDEQLYPSIASERTGSLEAGAAGQPHVAVYEL